MGDVRGVTNDALPCSFATMVRRRLSPAFAGGVLLLLALAAPARAHVGVVIGGGFGYPAWPYYYGPYAFGPYPYPYYAPYPYPYPYPVYSCGPYGNPPPGFTQGHWEWRADGRGGRIRVWVPGYLQ